MASIKLPRFITSVVVAATFTISSSTINSELAVASEPDWCTNSAEVVSIYSAGLLRHARFFEACREHDICYFTLNSGRRYCDTKFKDNLYDICKREFNTIAGKLFREECFTKANIYYEAVYGLGVDGYNTAQIDAKEVEKALQNRFPDVDISRYYGDIARELAVYQATHGSILNASERVRGDSIRDVVETISAKMPRRTSPPIRQAIRQVNRVLLAEEQIKQLYRQVLGREADPGGLQHHLDILRSGQQTFEQIRAGIASGQESRNNINNLYRQYLNRDADPGGMEHHVNLLASGQQTFEQIREGIKNSEEARNLRGE